MGTSILRASAEWFSKVNTGSTSGNFVSLDDSTNVTLNGITIDARTNDSGLYSNSTPYAGVLVCPPVGGKVSIEGSEIQGVTYGLSSESPVNPPCGLVDILNSKINSSTIALWDGYISGTWHIFATDLRATDTGVRSGPAPGRIAALSTSIGDFSFWGSHLHAESSVYGAYDVTTVHAVGSPRITIVGSTVHVKITTTQSTGNRRMFAAYPGGSLTLTLVGTEILYESPAFLAGGRLAGIGVSAQGTINLVGSTFRDGGGSGGTSRSDLFSILGAPFAGLKIAGTKVSSFASGGGNPSNLAKEFDTLGTQKGVAQFQGSSTFAVVLPVALPDTNYRVSVSADRNETIWVTSKTASGFTLNSSNSGSTANVEWLLMR